MEAQAELRRVLEAAKARGLLGPGPVEFHVEHARAHLGEALPEPGEHWADLGSGAGLPGLFFGLMREDLSLVLVERAASRCEFLRWAIVELQLEGRLSVLECDAVDAGRSKELRGRLDGVVARAFGPPAAVAECAAPLLRPGGLLLVSEPPEPKDDRWPVEGLAALGMGPADLVGSNPRFARIVQTKLVGEGLPRRWARIRRDPLFG